MGAPRPRRVPRLLQITDAARVPFAELVARIERGGPELAVQLRDPALDARALFALGQALRERSRAAGALLFVNDRLDLAALLGADGVHLGRRSVSIRCARAFLGEVLVSVSAHDVEEAVARAEQGADAVLLSPVFASPGKGRPLGAARLTEARARMSGRCALLALGGVDRERARECLAAGADGVAAVRADLTLGP